MSARSDITSLPDSVLPAALDLTTDAVVVVDPSTSIRYVNRGARAMFGRTSEALLGASFDTLLAEGARERHRRHLLEFAESGEAVRSLGEDGTVEGLRSDGERFPVEASLCRVETGGATFFVAIVRDVTEHVRLLEQEAVARRQAQIAERRAHFLAVASEALSETLDHEQTIETVGHIAVPDLADWSVVYVSERGDDPRRVEVVHRNEKQQAFLRTVLHDLPLDPEALDPVRHVMERGVPARLSDTFSLAWSGLARDGRAEQLDGVLRRHYGLLVPLLLRGAPIGALFLFRARSEWRRFDGDEIALISDLARRAALAIENARLHRDARETARLRDEILGVVSHDLRNPISIIAMTVSLMRDLELTPEETDRRLAVIERTAESMNRLVVDLLDVSRIEAGRLALDQTSWDPAMLIDKAYQAYVDLSARHSLTLERGIAADLPPVVADIERVSQVFGNLVGNAIKFTPAGGTITLEADSADGMVEFRVRDTGPGIEREHVEHVFDRFWQAKHRRRTGAGLGLAIVKGIVEAHGGQVGVRTRLGHGSVFWFTLPVDRRVAS